MNLAERLSAFVQAIGLDFKSLSGRVQVLEEKPDPAPVTVTVLNIDGGDSSTPPEAYVIRIDLGNDASNINPDGIP